MHQLRMLTYCRHFQLAHRERFTLGHTPSPCYGKRCVSIGLSQSKPTQLKLVLATKIVLSVHNSLQELYNVKNLTL